MSEVETLPPLTLFAEVGPVSPTPQRGSAKAATMTATSGMSSPESLAKLSPDGWWEKTSPDSSAAPTPLFPEITPEGFSDEFCETWPKWGSMRSGHVSRLPPSVPTTSETGCSSLRGTWPTPRSSDGVHAPSRPSENTAKRVASGRANLAEHVQERQMWPTPTSREGTGPGHPDSKKGSPNLRTVAQMWPTPCAQDGKNSTLPPSQQERDTIPGALMRQMWPTPKASEAQHSGRRTNSGHQEHLAVAAFQHGQEATGNSPTPSRQVLSVEFVTWLMGLPCGWLNLPDSVTASYLSRRRSSGGRSRTRKPTGNGGE